MGAEAFDSLLAWCCHRLLRLVRHCLFWRTRHHVDRRKIWNPPSSSVVSHPHLLVCGHNSSARDLACSVVSLFSHYWVAVILLCILLPVVNSHFSRPLCLMLSLGCPSGDVCSMFLPWSLDPVQFTVAPCSLSLYFWWYFQVLSCSSGTNGVQEGVRFPNEATRWCYGIVRPQEERDSAATESPSLHNSSTLGSKMIHLDSTNHCLIPNMIVLKFISWAELDVIVNCNEWRPFVHCKCMTHYIMVWKQMHFLFALF